jgi:cytochrome c peroxidase
MKTNRFMKQSIVLMLVAALVAQGGYVQHAFGNVKPQIANPELIQQIRQAAVDAGLKPLSKVPVPMPNNLNEFLNPGKKSELAAIQLGKALFWDMQVGSDGQSCGSCHFHAGADNRAKNQLSPGLKNENPALQTIFNPTACGNSGGPNYTLTELDFPFHQLDDMENENFATRTVLFDTDDIASSQGVFAAEFLGITPGRPFDLGTYFLDEVFSINGANTRRVEPRNTPTMINAVFNFANFMDGRAHNEFNGVSPLGPLDENAKIWVRQVYKKGERLDGKKVSIPNSSLASQAVGPPQSNTEMSFFNRPFPEIGRKLLSLKPLGLQRVHPNDSVLGALSAAKLRGAKVAGAKGLKVTYADLIKKAFQPRYWKSAKSVDGFTQMEANFSLFFGLAVQMYEATLVSGYTPFDAFMAGDDSALSDRQLKGLLVFIRTPTSVGAVFTDDIGVGNCVSCHGGPEFTDASVSSVEEEPIEVEDATELVDGLLVVSAATTFLDNGFANIGVRPTNDDLGRGGIELGKPLSFVRQNLAGFAFAPPLPECGGPDQTACPEGFPENPRVAVDGAFKIPGLRNVELTGPYFHNGGQATLGQVVEFYDRHGDFGDVNVQNIDRQMARIELVEGNEEPLVEFMLALTDPRVKDEEAPFDHPELFVPNGHSGDNLVLECVWESQLQACDRLLRIPAVGKYGRPAAGLEPLKTFLELDPD